MQQQVTQLVHGQLCTLGNCRVLHAEWDDEDDDGDDKNNYSDQQSNKPNTT